MPRIVCVGLALCWEADHRPICPLFTAMFFACYCALRTNVKVRGGETATGHDVHVKPAAKNVYLVWHQDFSDGRLSRQIITGGCEGFVLLLPCSLPGGARRNAAVKWPSGLTVCNSGSGSLLEGGEGGGKDRNYFGRPAPRNQRR